MTIFHWDLLVPEPPAVLHYCKKCGTKTKFHSSGLFRINAQRKALDIWLIYRCHTCDTTWNFTIASRIRPDRLDKRLLERFHRNDRALALQHACDTAKLQQNGALPDPFHITVTGPVPEMQQDAELHLHTTFPVPFKPSAVLHQKLKLSHRVLEQLEESGQLVCTDGRPLKRTRLSQETILLLQPPYPWVEQQQEAGTLLGPEWDSQPVQSIRKLP